jgi:hypothetical protein
MPAKYWAGLISRQIGRAIFAARQRAEFDLVGENRCPMIGAVALAFSPAVIGVFENNDVLRFVVHDEPGKSIDTPP